MAGRQGLPSPPPGPPELGAVDRGPGGRPERPGLGPSPEGPEEDRPPHLDDGGRRGGRERGGSLLAGSRTFVRVLEGDEVVRQGGDVPAQTPPLPRRDGFATLRFEGEPWRSLVVPAPGARGVRVQLFESLEIVRRQVGRTRRFVVGCGLLALALTAVAAWGATALLLRPLARLRAAAANVSSTDDLRSRLP